MGPEVSAWGLRQSGPCLSHPQDVAGPVWSLYRRDDKARDYIGYGTAQDEKTKYYRPILHHRAARSGRQEPAAASSPAALPFSAPPKWRAPCRCSSKSGVRSFGIISLRRAAFHTATTFSSSSIVRISAPHHSGRFARTSAAANGGGTALPHRATCLDFPYELPL